MVKRLNDWLRERRIARYAAQANAALDAGRANAAQSAWFAMILEINQRSPEQVARMEIARGLKPAPRTALKRALIAGHARGLVPSFIVAGLFRLFQLRGQ